MKTGQILVARPEQSIVQLSSFAFNGISVRNYNPNNNQSRQLKRQQQQQQQAQQREQQVNRVNQMNA